jgi:aspartate 4-decarboxylase
MNKDNVVDRLIARLPEKDRDALRDEYSIVTTDPDSMRFIDRMCADSRSIGLYHTSGLSTPSQVFMDILSLTHLVNKDADPYIEQSKQMVRERYDALMQALGLDADTGNQNARYYALIDVNALAAKTHGDDFAAWKREHKSDIDFLDDLASRKGVVLMYGPGFEAPEGSVRVSLANLNKEDYVEIARRVRELLDEYHEEYARTAQPAQAQAA